MCVVTIPLLLLHTARNSTAMCSIVAVGAILTAPTALNGNGVKHVVQSLFSVVLNALHSEKSCMPFQPF